MLLKTVLSNDTTNNDDHFEISGEYQAIADFNNSIYY
jgi:hypothetical protein